MKINYSILWIDDQPMRNDISRIENYLRKEGFILKIDKRISGKTMDSTIDFKKYNLIILDYHLNNGETTDIILKQIKGKQYYSEVIFYSSKGKFLNFIQDNFEIFEGVFWCESRGNDLFLKITSIIELTLKKFQDLNNLRGLVMAETADLDKLKKEIFKTYFTLNHKNRSQFENKICKKIEISVKDVLKDIKKYQGKTITYQENNLENGNSQNIFNLLDNMVFDFYKKGRCIEYLINYINSSSPFIFDNYNTKIISKRNKLAHEPEREENEIIYFGNLAFTPDECKIIRQDIINYHKLFENLLSDVQKLKQN